MVEVVAEEGAYSVVAAGAVARLTFPQHRWQWGRSMGMGTGLSHDTPGIVFFPKDRPPPHTHTHTYTHTQNSPPSLSLFFTFSILLFLSFICYLIPYKVISAGFIGMT